MFMPLFISLTNQFTILKCKLKLSYNQNNYQFYKILIWKMKNNKPSAFFPPALQFPDFFNDNLTDQNRIIKVVKGKQCWVRAFYFQLFKLIFQTNLDYKKNSDLIQILISSAKHTLTNIENSQKNAKLKESINTVEVFIKNLANNSDLQFQTFINQNQYVDQALIDIFSQVISQTIYKDQDIYEKLKFLGELFNQSMSFFEMGIKYEQSDIFVYVQNDQQLYLAYLNISQFNQKEADDQYNQKQSQSINQNQVLQSQQAKQIVENKQIQTDTKVSPVQYLFTNKFRQHQENQNIKIQQNKNVTENQNTSQNANKNDSKNTMQFTLGIRKQNEQSQSSKQAKLKKSQTKEEYSREQVKKQQSIVENYNQPELLKVQPTKFVISQVKSLPNEELFYRPSQKVGIKSIINSRIDMNSKMNKKDPLDCVNESQKGTFYRKFTNTRILNLITEPHRTKVKMLKNRFVGVHSRNTYNDI